MKAEFDLVAMKWRQNPYASTFKKPVTLRLPEDVLAYFKDMAAEAGVPFQRLIDHYLRDCIANRRRIQIK